MKYRHSFVTLLMHSHHITGRWIRLQEDHRGKYCLFHPARRQ